MDNNKIISKITSSGGSYCVHYFSIVKTIKDNKDTLQIEVNLHTRLQYVTFIGFLQFNLKLLQTIWISKQKQCAFKRAW